MARFAPRLPFRFAASLGALLAVASVARADEYRLQPGDSVDFAVLGVAQLQRRIVVSQDGEVRVPIGGAFRAAGRTIDELRADIVDKLKSASYPAGVDEQGSPVWNVIYPEGVLVEIGDYLPIYVSGDVLTPGSQAFRFGMTVQQATTVAGGFSAFRSRQDHSLEEAGIESEMQDALAAEFRARLRIARLEAELVGAAALDFGAISGTGLPAPLVAELKTLERQQFDARRDDHAKSRENLATSLRSAQSRFDYLRQSQVNLQAETANYEGEVRRVQDLLRKGLTPVERLNEAQRAMFLVSTRSLDTSAEVAKMEREIADLERATQKLDDDVRMENLAALQDASGEAARAGAAIEAVERKRALLRTNGAEGPRIVLARRDGERIVRMDAGPDTGLMPGDLLEVALPEPERAPRSAEAAADVTEPASSPEPTAAAPVLATASAVTSPAVSAGSATTRIPTPHAAPR
ncbi:polysaccharide biosynthesis/export family protein [Aureimonas sp. ME7]|uniref:polysaccharide biosynthesis/export family protein n=1 Tax=Aureimonas sp. ME7 TaxID=2744252 RepID=UPI0015F77AA5|nr:polysaccharide biosynthesis/export family protein [Aureimonas sp. ME7]